MALDPRMMSRAQAADAHVDVGLALRRVDAVDGLEFFGRLAPYTRYKCFEAIIVAGVHGDKRYALALGRGFVENNFLSGRRQAMGSDEKVGYGHKQRQDEPAHPAGCWALCSPLCFGQFVPQRCRSACRRVDAMCQY